jgi:Uma2 family endonuclease
MDRDTYLAFERNATEKHELWDGDVYAMAGASLAHHRLVRNLVRQLGNALEGSQCEPLPSDMRIRIPMRDRYVYPDVTIVCGPPELEGEADVLLNPRTILEVLSPSTAAFDRGDKFTSYRTIPSVRQIVFVDQDVRQVECYTRQDDGSWVLREYRGEDALPLEPLADPLPLSRIYEGVVLPSAQ